MGRRSKSHRSVFSVSLILQKPVIYYLNADGKLKQPDFGSSFENRENIVPYQLDDIIFDYSMSDGLFVPSVITDL